MCHCCNDARPDPASYRLFAEGCLHCAARRIQFLQRIIFCGEKPHVVEKRQVRCGKALSDALSAGLDGHQVRALARNSEWQIAPPLETKNKSGKK